MNLRLYPTSHHALVYILLVTVPLVGIFTAILFYEWFGEDSYLADTTLVTSFYVSVYTGFVIVLKLFGLYWTNKRTFLKDRLKVICNAFLGNVAVFALYFAKRWFFG